MRAGSGHAGIVAVLSLAVLASEADAQPAARSRAPAHAAAEIAKPAFATRLPGSMLLDTPLLDEGRPRLDAELLVHRLAGEDEEDEPRGVWGGLAMLPGQGNGRSRTLPAGEAHGWLRAGGAGLRLARGLATLAPGADDERSLPDAAANGVAHMADPALLRAAGADVDARTLPPGLGGEPRGRSDDRGAVDLSRLTAQLPGALALDFDLDAETGAAVTPAAITALVEQAALSEPGMSVNPEPASLVLMGTGLAAVGALARRRRLR